MKRLWVVLLVCSCYSPSLHDGQFTCEHSSACPTGYECICQLCRKSGSSCDDLAVPADLSSADAAAPSDAASDLGSHDLAVPPRDLATADLRQSLPGCSSGARSAQDPGRANVALCPAAWTLPGITTGTPCGRVVDNSGKNGATSCSSEDNCASGWHVCNDEADLTVKGFSADDCKSVNGASALWVTRQIGSPPSPGPSPGPPVCSGTMAGPVFGCGGYGGAPDSVTCLIFQHVLVNGMSGTDKCSQDTQTTFSCGTVSGPELNDVVKPARNAGGGVICCAN